MRLIGKVIHFVILALVCIITVLLNIIFNLSQHNDLGEIILFCIFSAALIGTDYYSNKEAGNLIIQTYESTYDILRKVGYEIPYSSYRDYDIYRIVNRYKEYQRHKKLVNYFGIILSCIVWFTVLDVDLTDGRAFELLVFLAILIICMFINASEMFPSVNANYVFPQEDFEFLLPHPSEFWSLDEDDRQECTINTLHKLEQKYMPRMERSLPSAANDITAEETGQIIGLTFAQPILIIPQIIYAFRSNSKYTIFFVGIVFSILNIAYIFV